MKEIYGFELIQDRTVPEMNTRARLFRHLKSGARLLSLENTDENKVFSITFRTPPGDSTGVAHIMEHAVLCGSRKYPVKEPFVELMKGSLNTFLNAMTYPDKTCYPVASQNLQDFYNLVDVYLDAVFYPLIPPHAFDQEGWHYELDELEAPLNYKGVVFNEMKGAYSSPDSLLADYAQRSLYPVNTYSFDSGGDPRAIPDLTYSGFKSFHQTFYHPSNAYIYFYGDDDPEQRLRCLDEYLRDFNAVQVNSEVTLQPRWMEPKRLAYPYDAGDENDGKKGMLVVNWLLGETLQRETTLAQSMLNHILIGSPASPLRKALIDSGLGEDLAGVGLEGDLRQMYFSTGMKGIADGSSGDQDFERVEALIFQTLQRLAQDGIDPETVAASVNTIEFRLRENNTGAFPRGLTLMLRSLTSWLYDGDPIEPLAYETPLAAIKNQIAAGAWYFENLIQTNLIDNLHSTTVILLPESGYQARQDAAERDKLDAIRAAFGEAELQDIMENTRQLKLRQETPDTPAALATIPSLRLEDLDQENKHIPVEISHSGSVLTLYHDLFTNGIIYLDLGLNLHYLPQKYLPYTALFGRALLEMGTEKEDFVCLSQRIGRATGGIRPVVFTTAVVGEKQAAAWLFLRGKATMNHATELLQILQDVLTTARLDNPERFRQMVLEEKADMEAMLVPAGHRVVNTRLRALYNQSNWVDEQVGGISYLFFLRKLIEKVDQDWTAVLQELEAIRQILVNRNQMLVNVTLDGANWEQFQPKLATLLCEAIQPCAVKSETWYWRQQMQEQPKAEGLIIPAQVNYVGKGASLFDLGYKQDGSVAVITKYLRSTWLWEKVRVQGGAYGGMCQFDHRSGVFTYLSYRDPNLLNTLEIYDRTSQFLRELSEQRLTQDELTKSIIGAIGEMDAYQLPDAKGFTSLARYLAGESDTMRQERREQILATSLSDFHAFAEAVERVSEAGSVVVMGSEDALRAAIVERPGWIDDENFAIQKVL